MIGAQVFTVLTFYCPERRPLGNPAKNRQKSSRKKTRSCRPWIWCARGHQLFWPQKCCLAPDSRDSSQRCRALLASQPGSKACALPACLPSVGLPAFSPPRAREPGFLENAFPSDNDILEFITKTWPSWAENRFIETAIPENIPAELSAARNSANHDPLSHPSSPGYTRCLGNSPC